MFVQFIFNIALQIVIYLIYLPEFFGVNNLNYRLYDTVHFIFYIITINIILRLLITVPLIKIVEKYSSQYAVVFMAIFESLFIILSTVDCLAYIDQGVHLYDSIVIRTLKNPYFLRDVHLSAISFLTLGLISVLFISTQVYLWNKIRSLNFFRTHKNKILYSNLSIFVLSFCITIYSIFNYFPQLGEHASLFPLYSIFSEGTPKSKPINFKLTYHYPPSPQLSLKKNIYLIMTESLRSDMINEEYTPRFMNFIRQKNCLISNYHYSGGHTTEYGVFTALYGLYGFHYNEFLSQELPSYGIKILKDNNYYIQGLSASQLSLWMGAGFMFKNFNNYVEFKSEVPYQDDQKMVEQAIQFSKDRSNKNDPFFLFMFFNSTHHNYHYPLSFQKYTPVLEENFNQFKSGRDEKGHKQKVYNRYRNSVTWVDHNLGNFLDYLQKEKDNDGIVAFTGDHGEEFWEEGLLGHSRTNYINPRVRVPFYLCSLKNTKKPIHKTVKLSSHVDIFPTLLNILQDNINLDQFNGKNLYDPNLAQIRPYIVITPPQFLYEKNNIGIITEQDKYWVNNSDHQMKKLTLIRKSNLDDQESKVAETPSQSIIAQFKTDAYRFLKIERKSSGPFQKYFTKSIKFLGQ